MRRAVFMALGTGAVITSVAAIGIGASAAGERQSISRSEYVAALRTVELSRDSVLARCESLAGYERESCRTEAAAGEGVRLAQIESDFRRDQPAARALQRARIDARYQVECARCGALSGFKRDRCLVQVHSTKGRALLDAAAPYEVRYSP